MSLDEVKKLVDRVSRSILGGQSIEVMDVPLGSLPGATEIGKGETNGLISIVIHQIFHRGVKSVLLGAVGYCGFSRCAATERP
jgi:hypothetical protein